MSYKYLGSDVVQKKRGLFLTKSGDFGAENCCVFSVFSSQFLGAVTSVHRGSVNLKAAH